MTKATTFSSIAPRPSLQSAWQDVYSSFERFCLVAGVGALEQMLGEDAEQIAAFMSPPMTRIKTSPPLFDQFSN